MIHQAEVPRKKRQILLGSAFASVFSTVLTNPFEVAKLNRQFFPLACPHYPHPSALSQSKCSCSRTRWSGSARSLKVALPQVLITNILFMQVYEHLRGWLVRQKMGAVQATLVSSFVARFLVTSLNLPFESLRIKLSNKVATDTAKTAFHGYRITLLRDMTYSAIFWSSLEYYRNHCVGGEYRATLKRDQTFTWKNFSLNLLPGFLIGSVVAAATTPLDTLKTRVQSQGLTKYAIWAGLKDIYGKEGVSGLFSGVGFRVLKSSLHIAVYLFIYEWALRNIRPNDLLMAGTTEDL